MKRATRWAAAVLLVVAAACGDPVGPPPDDGGDKGPDEPRKTLVLTGVELTR